MKTLSIIVYLFAIPMTRVTRVVDSHTIVANNAAVVLRGVDIGAADEEAAAQYLHRLLDGAWVYVEDGNVYRSPDGLYINGELQRHAWRTAANMRYLGEVSPGPIRSAAVRPPARSARVASPSRARRRSRPR